MSYRVVSIVLITTSIITRSVPKIFPVDEMDKLMLPVLRGERNRTLIELRKTPKTIKQIKNETHKKTIYPFGGGAGSKWKIVKTKHKHLVTVANPKRMTLWNQYKQLDKRIKAIR